MLHLLAFSASSSSADGYVTGLQQPASMSSAPPLNHQRSLTPRGTKLNAVLSKPSTNFDTSSRSNGVTSRRRALQSLIVSSGATSLAFVGAWSKANALDMDAFVNSQVCQLIASLSVANRDSLRCADRFFSLVDFPLVPFACSLNPTRPIVTPKRTPNASPN